MNVFFLSLFTICIITLGLQAQVSINLDYEVSNENPFGLVNPESKAYLADFAPLIGQCECKSVGRNPDRTWADTVDMLWKFKYIMNGKAIQDETWKADGRHSGSIRQFQPDSAQWVVTYFSQPGITYTPGVWIGGKVGENIILKKKQNAPNGMEGFSRLTFSNISEEGFDWVGEWVKSDETIVYPFWQIFCKKQE